MHGGIRPFRGTGADARRYVESDRSTADDYYLKADAAFASWTLTDATGEPVAVAVLEPEQYAAWVDWTHPITGEVMGKPRTASSAEGDKRKGSPRFQEMIVNSPKSLSIAAALHPDVSEALDRAQADAANEIRRYLAAHATTRVGPLGAQEVVPVESLQTVGIVHHTSRAGDPHRHIHFQIGTRVWAAGAWRGLDGVAFFRQQGAIRALGTAVMAAHPALAEALAAHGLTLDHITGEVAELEPFNALMSKRGAQVEGNLAALEAKWAEGHPGESMSRTTAGRLRHRAWAQDRPDKKPATLKDEEAWRTELREAGYAPETLHRPKHRAPAVAVTLDSLSQREIANRALDRLAAASSAWTPHVIREQVAQLVTEAGTRATSEGLRGWISATADLALADCLTILPPDAATPEHVAHLTSLTVVAAETRLRDLLTELAPENERDGEVSLAELGNLADERSLDDGQRQAAAAIASSDPLVIVEGAAGSGKTSMLAVALAAMPDATDAAPGVARNPEAPNAPDSRNRRALAGIARVVAPTRRAAQVAEHELGVPATSVAALVHANGWRWNDDGVWHRLAVGDADPETGKTYDGPPTAARLARGERVIVDEAGMLDQDTTIALLTIIQEAGATVALVGDRAQLPAVGRGGVLGMAAQVRGRTFDMSEVHRFASEDYADLTLAMRDRQNPAAVFDHLAALGLVTLLDSDEDMREHIAATAEQNEAVTVATNEEAAALNECIRAQRVSAGLVDDTTTVTGNDGLPIGAGDLIQTRRNDNTLGVANRQNWTVQKVECGAVWVREANVSHGAPKMVRLPAEYVAEHAHLSYTATACGVQGITAPSSHTVLSESISAAGIYVGMTRGRGDNRLHVVAGSLDEAKELVIEATERDRADRGRAAATAQAMQGVAGLIAPAPVDPETVAIIDAEKARLAAVVEQAQVNAARWKQGADVLTRQADRHRQERSEQETLVQQAKDHLAQVRAEVVAPLTAQATSAATMLHSAHTVMQTAEREARDAGPFRRKSTERAADLACAEYRQTVDWVRQRWGSTPTTPGDAAAWVTQVAARATEQQPAVTDAREQETRARTDLTALDRQQEQETQHARIRVYGQSAGLRAPRRDVAQLGGDWTNRRPNNPGNRYPGRSL